MSKWLPGHSDERFALPTDSVNKNVNVSETTRMMQIFIFDEVTSKTHLLKVSGTWQIQQLQDEIIAATGQNKTRRNQTRLITPQGGLLKCNGKNLSENGVKSFMTLKLAAASLPGGAQAALEQSKPVDTYNDVFKDLRVQLAQTVADWERQQSNLPINSDQGMQNVNQEFERIFASIERGRRRFDYRTPEEKFGVQDDLFRRLVRKLVTVQESGDLDDLEGVESVEAFIRTRSLRDAFDCFVALSQTKYRGGLINALSAKDLTEEQSDLLGFMRKTTGGELAELFNKNLTSIVGLVEFISNVVKSCKDPQQLKSLFMQTSSADLKQRVFTALVQPTLQNQNQRELVSSFQLSSWASPEDQNILFQLISLLSMVDHNNFVSTMPQQWKDGYQNWKSLVAATGRTDHDPMDFLAKGGPTPQATYAEDDPFIAKGHRNLTAVDLPDPILDEAKRLRNGRPQLVRVVNTQADCNFEIDNGGDCALSQHYYGCKIVICPEGDPANEQVLCTLHEPPVKFYYPDLPRDHMDSHLFQGEDGEIFWFTYRPEYRLLELCLLPHESDEFEVIAHLTPDDALFQHMTTPRFYVDYEEQWAWYPIHTNYHTTIPKMCTVGGRRFIAFCDHKHKYPEVAFYSLDERAVKIRVKNAEFMVHTVGRSHDPSEQLILFKSEKITLDCPDDQRGLKRYQFVERHHKVHADEDVRIAQVDFAAEGLQEFDLWDAENLIDEEHPLRRIQPPLPDQRFFQYMNTVMYADTRAGRVITQSAPDNNRSQIFTIQFYHCEFWRAISSSYAVDLDTMTIANLDADEMGPEEKMLWPGLSLKQKQETPWKIRSVPPFVLLTHDEMPRDFFVEHLLEKENKRVHFHLSDYRNVLHVDQFLGLAKTTYVGFTMVLWKGLHDDGEDQQMDLYNISLEEPLTQGTFTDVRRWKSGYKETKPPAQQLFKYLGLEPLALDKYRDVLENAYRIKKCFMTKLFNHNRAMIYTTSESIKLIAMDLANEGPSLLSPGCDFVDVCPIISASERVYFVERDSETQQSHVVCYAHISRDLATVGRVYSTMASIVNLQLVQQSQLDVVIDYETTDIASQWLGSVKDRIYVITDDFSVTTIAQIGNYDVIKPYIKKETFKILEVQGMQAYIDADPNTLKEILITERALIFRGVVLARKSGQQFTAFDFESQKAQKEFGWEFKNEETQIMPGTDVLMTRATRAWQKDRNNVNGTYRSVVVENDPSRRTHNMIGNKLLKNVLSLNVISKDLLLLRLSDSNKDGVFVERKIDFCLININGEIQEISEKLRNIFITPWEPHVDNGKPWFRYATRAQSCIVKGNVCRILLYSEMPQLKKNNRAELVELSSTGELLSHKLLPYLDEVYGYQEYVMSRNGELARVECKTKERANIITENYDVSYGGFEDGPHGEKIRIIRFENLQEGQEFVYTGEFLCWSLFYSQKIVCIYLGDAEAAGDGNAGRGPGNKAVCPRTEITELDVALFGDARQVAGGFTISTQQPLTAAKMSQTGLLTKNSLKEMQEQLVVSFIDCVKVFALEAVADMPVATLVAELAGTKMLLDPQDFVQTPVECTTAHEMMRVFAFTKGRAKESIKFTQAGLIALHTCWPFYDKYIVPEGKQDRLRRVRGIYRGFARMDYLQLTSLVEMSKGKTTPEKFELETLNASFGPKSVFTELSGVNKYDVQILETIDEILRLQEFKPVQDYYGNWQSAPALRRLSDAMQRNTSLSLRKRPEKGIVELVTGNLVPSCLADQATAMAITDCILQIGSQTPEFNIFDSLGTQDEFAMLVKDTTPQVLAALNDSRSEPTSVKMIDYIEWPTEEKIGCFTREHSVGVLTYESRHMDVDETKMNEYFSQNGKFVQSKETIKAHIINLDWFYRDGKTIIDLAETLMDQPDELYACEFVSHTLGHFWPKIKAAILLYRCLPQVALTIFFSFSAIASLGQTSVDLAIDLHPTIVYTLNFITFFFILIGLYIEVRQLVNQGFRGYFGTIWNYLDAIAISFSTAVTVMVLLKSDRLQIDHLRLLSAIGALALYSKTLLEWLRLFDSTAFYIRLVQEAVSDIIYFMVVFLVTIFLFGVPVALLGLNFPESLEGDEPFKTNPYQILYQQYLIALGEFPLDDWDQDGLPWVWVIQLIFLATTFLQTITMLNVLVAIMMETFSRINNAAEIYNNKMKIDTICELEVQLLPDEFRKVDAPFKLVVIKPAFNTEFESDPVLQAIGLVKTQIANIAKSQRDNFMLTQSQSEQTRAEFSLKFEKLGQRVDSIFRVVGDIRDKFYA